MVTCAATNLNMSRVARKYNCGFASNVSPSLIGMSNQTLCTSRCLSAWTTSNSSSQMVKVSKSLWYVLLANFVAGVFRIAQAKWAKRSGNVANRKVAHELMDADKGKGWPPSRHSNPINQLTSGNIPARTGFTSKRQRFGCSHSIQLKHTPTTQCLVQ